MKRTFNFNVKVPRVPGVSSYFWRDYIEEAVRSWAGQFEPVDGGYPDSLPQSGHPLGPPCDWNEKVKVTFRRPK